MSESEVASAIVCSSKGTGAGSVANSLGSSGYDH